MVFRNSTEPAFCVTFELDITGFLKKIKDRKLSFTLAMVYAACSCANTIEEFRYRFLDGKVVLFDKIDTAFTYLNRETELFKVVNVPLTDSLEEYVALAAGLPPIKRNISPGRWEMMCFSAPPCPGYLIPIFPTQIPGKRKTPRLCSTGENILKETAESCCPSLSRHTIRLWMEFM